MLTTALRSFCLASQSLKGSCLTSQRLRITCLANQRLTVHYKHLPLPLGLHTSGACQKLQEGDSASLSRTITKEEVLQYAELTGDFNPVHLGDDKSDGVVHGALLLGLVSGLVASRLPGPGTQLAGIQARFPRPCKVGTGVIVTVTLGKVRKLTPVRFTVVDFWSRETLVEGEAAAFLTPEQLKAEH